MRCAHKYHFNRYVGHPPPPPSHSVCYKIASRRSTASPRQDPPAAERPQPAYVNGLRFDSIFQTVAPVPSPVNFAACEPANQTVPPVPGPCSRSLAQSPHQHVTERMYHPPTRPVSISSEPREAHNNGKNTKFDGVCQNTCPSRAG